MVAHLISTPFPTQALNNLRTKTRERGRLEAVVTGITSRRQDGGHGCRSGSVPQMGTLIPPPHPNAGKTLPWRSTSHHLLPKGGSCPRWEKGELRQAHGNQLSGKHSSIRVSRLIQELMRILGQENSLEKSRKTGSGRIWVRVEELGKGDGEGWRVSAGVWWPEGSCQSCPAAVAEKLRVRGLGWPRGSRTSVQMAPCGWEAWWSPLLCSCLVQENSPVQEAGDWLGQKKRIIEGWIWVLGRFRRPKRSETCGRKDWWSLATLLSCHCHVLWLGCWLDLSWRGVCPLTVGSFPPCL